MKKNNKGFAISGVIYPLLIIVTFFTIQILFMLNNRKVVLDDINAELVEQVDANNKVYTNEEITVLLEEQNATIAAQNDKIKELENEKLDKTYVNQSSIAVHKPNIGNYYSNISDKYIVFKVGELKQSNPSMILANINLYSYSGFNSIEVGFYVYSSNNTIHAPSASYTQSQVRYPIHVAVDNNQIYIIVEKGAGGYVGVYVEEIMMTHYMNVPLIETGWEVYTASSLTDFDKVFAATIVN